MDLCIIIGAPCCLECVHGTFKPTGCSSYCTQIHLL